MASAYGVAVLLVFALAGLLVLPTSWWLLAYWQKKRGLNELSRTSIYWSITPFAAALIFIAPSYVNWIAPAVALITFFLVPIINVGALVVAVGVTVFKVGRRNAR